MAKPAREAVDLRDFPGLVTRVDPDDTPPGAAREQTNLTSLGQGELRSRAGYRPVTFEEE